MPTLAKGTAFGIPGHFAISTTAWMHSSPDTTVRNDRCRRIEKTKKVTRSRTDRLTIGGPNAAWIARGCAVAAGAGGMGSGVCTVDFFPGAGLRGSPQRSIRDGMDAGGHQR